MKGNLTHFDKLLLILNYIECDLFMLYYIINIFLQYTYIKVLVYFTINEIYSIILTTIHWD
jgi:hypothetical protein